MLKAAGCGFLKRFCGARETRKQELMAQGIGRGEASMGALKTTLHEFRKFYLDRERADLVEKIDREAEEWLKRERELLGLPPAPQQAEHSSPASPPEPKPTQSTATKKSLPDRPVGAGLEGGALPAAVSEATDAVPPSAADLAWVYQNKVVGPGQEIGECPSNGARGLLAAARVDAGVYKWVLDRMCPKTFADESDGEDDDALELVGLADGMMADFHA